MLLLMMEAEVEARRGFLRDACGEEGFDGGVDVSAVVEDGTERRPRECGAEFLFRLGGDTVVVAVEEPEEIRMERGVAGREFAEDEGFKEPCGVCEVPLRGAGLGRGLHHHVLRRERFTEGERLAAHGGEARDEVRETVLLEGGTGRARHAG